jgi:hypothetical protein
MATWCYPETLYHHRISRAQRAAANLLVTLRALSLKPLSISGQSSFASFIDIDG